MSDPYLSILPYHGGGGRTDALMIPSLIPGQYWSGMLSNASRLVA